MARNLRKAQINGQCSVTVLRELRVLIEEFQLDMICIQEPYTWKGKVPYMAVSARVVADGKAPMTAIFILNKRLRMLKVSQF